MQISTISPSTFDDGKSVTLTGSGFGSSQGQVLIGGVAQNVNTWSDDEITFTTVRGSQSLGACRVDVVAADSTWQLASDRFVAAKLPLTAVYPRPDSETPSWARHRKAYPDGTAEYRVPVTLLGGAYPYYFELLQGPPGMQVGSTYGNTDYGVVTWTPTVGSGPHTVQIRVTDQALQTVTVQWTVTAAESDFVFIDPAVAVSGTGTKASPLKTFADMHKGTRTDATYSGKILYLRGGTHTLSGPEASGNLQLENNYKPAVWLGYTGETVIVDASSCKIVIDDQDDIFAAHFRMTSARNDVANAHFWFFNQNAAQARATFFDMSFDDIARGTSGTDNPAAIASFNPGSLRNHFVLKNIEYSAYTSPLLDAYAMSYGVIDGVTLLAGDAATVNQGVLLKSDVQNFSVRNVTSVVQDFTYGAIEVLMQAQTVTNDEIEISYNRITSVGGASVRALVYNWQTAQGFNSSPSIYVYRNTITGVASGLDGFAYEVDLEKNVFVSDTALQQSGTNRVINDIDNQEFPSNTTDIDANGILVGGSASLRGKYGHEIYGG